jgi:hypothetical protein
MKAIPFPLCLFLVLVLGSPSISSQQSYPGTPGKQEIAKHPMVLEPPAGPQPKNIDPAKIHDEANELARLAASVPNDVDQITQGKLPKDFGDKLKRIEKLSKNLRGEIVQ